MNGKKIIFVCIYVYLEKYFLLWLCHIDCDHTQAFMIIIILSWFHLVSGWRLFGTWACGLFSSLCTSAMLTPLSRSIADKTCMSSSFISSVITKKSDLLTKVFPVCHSSQPFHIHIVLFFFSLYGIYHHPKLSYYFLFL